MRPKSLIGIVGFKSPENTAAVFGSAEQPVPVAYQLMAGVVASPVNKTWEAFPERRDVLGLMYVEVGQFARRFIDNLHIAIGFGGMRCKGLILDMKGSWPSERDLEVFRSQGGRGAKIALVVDENMLLYCEHAPAAVSKCLGRYKECIEYAFICPNGGGYNTVWCERCLGRIYNDHPRLGIGIAQDIGPSNIRKLMTLRRTCPELSLVAGKQVRTPDGWVDPYLASQFIERAEQFLTAEAV